MSSQPVSPFFFLSVLHCPLGLAELQACPFPDVVFSTLFLSALSKQILIECADLLEIRNKYFEEKSLYSLFRNVIPEIIFDFLREIGVFYGV